jgi:hypothetical protein
MGTGSTGTKTASASGLGDWVGRQADDPKPILYFSGIPKSSQLTEEEFLKAGVRFRCLSYGYTAITSPLYSKANEVALDFCMRNGVRVFLDSGAHTLQNLFLGRKSADHLGKTHAEIQRGLLKVLDKWLVDYSAYVESMTKKYKRRFDFYVNVDYRQHCPAIYEVLQRLYKLGCRAVPVYHGDASLDWVRRYIDDGHKLIGVGRCQATGSGTRKQRYFDTLFNLLIKHDIAAHGFMLTDTDMFRYPWYSVDSTSWLKAASFGSIYDYAVAGNLPVLRAVYVSDVGRKNAQPFKTYSPTQRKELRQKVEARGADLEKLQSSLAARGLYNAKLFLEIMNKFSYQGPKIKWNTLF